ncbi:SCP1-like small phosphatase 4 [Forsythia ovata]|uniref:SCP1-like small phosphatase 4 n=1 Tax=Forsythia ovata TaxID=205694 RepID=A0ABD1R7C1_9LAMI
MKTKSTTGCLKEENALHVCRKSSMISKSPLSHTRIVQNVEVGTFIQSSHDVFLCDDLTFQDARGCEANHNELSNEENLFQKQQSPATDSTTTESTPLTCTSKTETIFSTIVQSLDFHNDEGSDHLYVPQLDTEDSEDSSPSSCKYQPCNMSDFYISDIIFSGSPAESNSVLDNNTDTTFLPDYKCEESSLFCELAEQYLLLPFLEDRLETGCDRDDKSCGETFIDVNNSSLFLGIHQLRSCKQESDVNIYPNLDQVECFDPHIYIRNLPDQLDVASTLLPATLPKEKQKSKQITLVLDLDETLVHSTLEHSDDADFTFPVFFNMKDHIVYVKKRPHLQTFLERVAEMFEIVVFTASQSIYAKQLLDILDPDGMLISRRAYRESCIFSEGIYIKDLTVLGVDLAKAAIIDNSPQVFKLQVNNGIPIKSWFDDPSDCALSSILPFLETLVDADDVRPIIAQKFGNKE